MTELPGETTVVSAGYGSQAVCLLPSSGVLYLLSAAVASGDL